MYHHVLVGTDGSPTATRAVTAAAQLAQIDGARLTIAHAFPAQVAPEALAGRLVDADLRWLAWPGTVAESVLARGVEHAQRVACGGLRVVGRAEPGRPVGVLAALAGELAADVVVVGNADVWRRRFRRGIGAMVARRVLIDVIVVDTIGTTGPITDRSVA